MQNYVKRHDIAGQYDIKVSGNAREQSNCIPFPVVIEHGGHTIALSKQGAKELIKTLLERL